MCNSKKKFHIEYAILFQVLWWGDPSNRDDKLK